MTFVSSFPKKRNWRLIVCWIVGHDVEEDCFYFDKEEKVHVDFCLRCEEVTEKKREPREDTHLKTYGVGWPD